MQRANYIVYDIETGGLSPSKNPITELAAVALDGDTFEEIGRFESLIKPYNDELEYSKGAIDVTGLTPERLEEEGKESKQVIKDFMHFVKESKQYRRSKPIFVGHNIIKFDNPFMVKFFEDHKKDLDKFIDLRHSIDTMYLAMIKFSEDNDILDYKHGTVCDKMGISLINAHRAMPDVEANVKLFSEFKNLLKGEGNNVSTDREETRFRSTFNF